MISHQAINIFVSFQLSPTELIFTPILLGKKIYSIFSLNFSFSLSKTTPSENNYMKVCFS